MYTVMTRYQYRKREGIIWTKWFSALGSDFDNENEAKEYMKHLSENSKTLDKKIKLKHEYKVEKVEE